VYNVYHIK
jgi:hypothetical protein